ncbi:MAG TPA: response regulator [Vicinamibacteria bacterium]
MATAAARKPDVIFCDVRMPAMDGFQLLERLQADPGLHDIPVIAMSGMGSEAELERIAGIEEHLERIRGRGASR